MSLSAQLRAALADRYALEAQIGVGGMATVFRAIDLRHDRPVALKVMHPEFAASIGRERFLREIRVTANLAHAHILPLHDSGVAGPLLYYVTPLVEGMSLRERLDREGRLPVNDVKKIARETADALAYAHGRDIVHRDIKPENILLSGYQGPGDKASWNVVVADFGIAAVRAVAAEDRMTRTGISLGSALYMSPEQALGESVDERTDIWSLGCVVYEMLAGAPPFGRDAKGALARSLTGRAAPIRGARTTGLHAVVMRALARDPADRFASIRDFAHALEQKDRPRRTIVLNVLAAISVIVVAGFVAAQIRASGAPTVEFTQLTNFTDAATAPALSPDGRFVAFLRGRGLFGNSATPSQLYVKQLPDGEAIQLTNTTLSKATPVFSPDGSRIAFTSSEGNFKWATDIVSANGGNVTQMLPNASGLTWYGDGRVLFSENRGGMHMGIRSSTLARGAVRDVYWPGTEVGMAHRSTASPDDRWTLVVEMDNGVWLPCRLLPIDGSTTGKQVGPRSAQCTYAAWAPNGRWMYFTANAGNGYHIWRQRFPDGTPEQLTHGPTEEEGIAVAPDGKSLITSAGVRLNTIKLLDDANAQSINVEGYAVLPQASADGTRAYYISPTGNARGAYQVGNLIAVTLASDAREQLLPEHQVSHFDLSADDRLIVFVSQSDDPAQQGIWVAPLDRSAAPRRVFDGETDRAFFDPDGNIYFAAKDAGSRYLHRLRAPGYTIKETVSRETVFYVFSISPDGKWVVVLATLAAGTGAQQVAISTRGLPTRILCSFCSGGGGPARLHAPAVSWTRDGRLFLVSGQYISTSALNGPPITVAVPVRPGRQIPDLPNEGITSVQDYLSIPGAAAISKPDVMAGATPRQLFFYESTVIRNLYRVRLR